MGFEEHKRKWVFFFIFVLLLLLAFFMFRPYLNAVIVGALLAYFIKPFYSKLLQIIKSKVASQIIIGLSACLILFLLIAILAFPLATQAQSLYVRSGQMVSGFVTDLQNCSDVTADRPACKLASTFSPLVNSFQFKERSNEFLQRTSLYIYDKLTGFIAGVVSFIIFLLVMLFSMFYFLGQGDEIKATILSILPLSRSDKRRIVQRLEETIRAVIGGNVTTAFLQGIAASLIFYLLNIPSPLFWGLIIAILAFIPGIGPSLVWIPMAVILIIQEEPIKAIILVVASVLLLTSIETLIKPKIIGTKIQMSTYAVFMSVLGGLHFFGLLGFFFGPILLALLITCIQIYREMDGLGKSDD